MKNYRVVLFDLDHTLWDFDRNSHETLQELYQLHQLEQFDGLLFDAFHKAFQTVNTLLWDQYDRGLIDREVIRHNRFNMVLQAVDVVHPETASRLAADYLSISPHKEHVVPGALDVLNYLSLRYPLFIVTNGFTEVQTQKVKSAGIEKYFEQIITSEMVGYKKPAKEIFDFVLQRSGFANYQAIMIGDNLLTDITGGINAGIDTVHFNPNSPHPPPEGGLAEPDWQGKITHEISSLLELKGIL